MKFSKLVLNELLTMINPTFVKPAFLNIVYFGESAPSFRAKLATSLSAEGDRECYQSMTKYN
ncbi:hypothetical protein HDF25_001102 [Pedobacter cryoconitis]|uniref:Uncharacterized protein n=1 Tax=Pedobacter cryoconitis TaxID=188932 RepID=A0A7X0MHL0_9SPHI|nr:hypothetical protein [Pedobacter cryoconitis]